MKNKNILYLTRTMGVGGTEKIIMQLCKAFNSKFNSIVVCSKGGVHVKELENLGIKHYTIPDFEDKKIKSIIITIKSIVDIVKNEQIHIVHTHHRMAAFYSLIARFFKKYVRVHTAHNTFNDKKIFTKIALYKSKVICVGEQVKNNLVNYYKLPQKSLEVIYNGIEESDKSKKDIKELVELKKDGYFLVTNISRLSEQKGLEYFIKSAYYLKQKPYKLKFIIVGTGELEDKLKGLVEEWNLNNNIIFMGYRDDIDNIIRHSDLIVLSSLWEGLPLTPIEAFMEKKTVIGTNVDGTIEIIEDNINGILVQPKDSKAISNAIIKLFKDDELRVNMENNAYDTYLQKFTIGRFIEKHYNLYKNITRGIK